MIDSGSPAGDTGGFMGDTTNRDAAPGGPDSGYLEGAGAPVIERGFDPMGALRDFAEESLSAKRAGPTLVGLLGPFGMGPVAYAAQELNEAARARGYSVVDPVRETAQFESEMPGNFTTSSDAVAMSGPVSTQGFLQQALSPSGNMGLAAWPRTVSPTAPTTRYQYKDGGMVGPGGVPRRPASPQEQADLQRLEQAVDRNIYNTYGGPLMPPPPRDTRSGPMPGEPMSYPEMSRMTPPERDDYMLGRLNRAIDQTMDRPTGYDPNADLTRMLDQLIQRYGGPGNAGPAPAAAPPMYQYAAGGMVGPGGVPQRPNAGPGLAPQGTNQPIPPQQVMSEAQRFAQQNPQQVQAIQGAIQQAMQTGELTQPELNMIVQMATVALQNPQMYPQLRQLAIQQGLATEQDISPQFDQGLLFVLVVIGQVMRSPAPQQSVPQPGAPPAPGGQPMPSMARGGPLPASSPNADGSIPITAHEGEYVIPAAVVRAKGTEFFDKLVMGYQGGNKSASS
jgi:hypothetical protein